MLDRSLEQVMQWGADNIQEYCGNLAAPLLQHLRENNCWVEDKAWRANHIFGFLLPASVDKTALLEDLKSRKIFVSLRGAAIRVSLHLYNNEADIAALVAALKK
jgi:selenocysteine lyase/cysteine desulfurase